MNRPLKDFVALQLQPWCVATVSERTFEMEIDKAVLGPLVQSPDTLAWARGPLHIQGSYPSRSLIKIITLYEPDANLWNDFKVRK